MGTRNISRQVLEIKRYKRESIKYPDETLKRLKEQRSSLILIYEPRLLGWTAGGWMRGREVPEWEVAANNNDLYWWELWLTAANMSADSALAWLWRMEDWWEETSHTGSHWPSNQPRLCSSSGHRRQAFKTKTAGHISQLSHDHDPTLANTKNSPWTWWWNLKPLALDPLKVVISFSSA